MNDKTAFRDVNENPCHMCMPIGGILPLKGIEASMVIIHGSQGCSTYMRRTIAEHFNEPVDVGSSSLNEKGTIYGGEKNLKQALDNIRKVYSPKLIGVLTTCLAETIGEDIERFAADYLAERQLGDLAIVTVSTPGYGGSQAEGYFLTVRQIVATLAEKTAAHHKINIIIPAISPADIREIKRLLALMDIQYTLCPDFSDTLDRPYLPTYSKMPPGGTAIADIRAMAGAAATIEMGLTVDDAHSPGRFLADQHGVPLYKVPIPIGLGNCDRFFAALTAITGKTVPDSVAAERGRLMDAMVDSHKYNFAGRAVIFGEPELVYAVTGTCLENGVRPAVVATGLGGTKLADIIANEAAEPDDILFLPETDFAAIRSHSVAAGANIAIGHSDGRFLTEREGIPLVRLGFPIHDRVGGQRLLSVGYTGTAMFLDRITNTLLEHKYRDYRSSMYTKYYKDGQREDNTVKDEVNKNGLSLS
ncbi:MAG: nitrogenase component 1 [Negativicutes bacterium]|nr:nitrogenase component 1 [Negativicutes bacterium]